MLGKLTYSLLFVGILLLLIILYLLKNEKITTRFTIVWATPIILIFLVALIPQYFMKIANFFGFQTISSLMIGILFGLLAYIVIALTIIVAQQNKKITLLIQELSLLKRNIHNKND